MRLQTRCAGLLTAALILVSAALGDSKSTGRVPASRDEGPAAQVAESPQSPASKPRVLTLEERADIFMARKNYADAADYYYKVIKHSDSRNPALWNKLGRAFQEDGKYHNAIKAYLNAIRADDQFAVAWNNIGTVYYSGNRFGKSVKYYQRAIALQNSSAPFHLNLGVSYLKMKKYEKAVEEYNTALSLDPSILVNHSALASVIQAKGTGPESYFYIAKALARQGRPEDAVRYLRRALEDGLKRSLIDEDPDFKKISQLPAYVELMRNPPTAIKD